jgi:hypothetical protein
MIRMWLLKIALSSRPLNLVSELLESKSLYPYSRFFVFLFFKNQESKASLLGGGLGCIGSRKEQGDSQTPFPPRQWHLVQHWSQMFVKPRLIAIKLIVSFKAI